MDFRYNKQIMIENVKFVYNEDAIMQYVKSLNCEDYNLMSTCYKYNFENGDFNNFDLSKIREELRDKTISYIAIAYNHKNLKYVPYCYFEIFIEYTNEQDEILYKLDQTIYKLYGDHLDDFRCEKCIHLKGKYDFTHIEDEEIAGEIAGDFEFYPKLSARYFLTYDIDCGYDEVIYLLQNDLITVPDFHEKKRLFLYLIKGSTNTPNPIKCLIEHDLIKFEELSKIQLIKVLSISKNYIKLPSKENIMVAYNWCKEMLETIPQQTIMSNTSQ